MLERSLPVIEPKEFEARWEAVSRYMEQNHLDALVAYGDDRATYGAAHIRYLADVPVHFEPMLLLFVEEKKPVLLCGPESDGFARLSGRVEDVRILAEMTHPDEAYLYNRIERLEQIVAEQAGGRELHRVGIAPKALMGGEIYGSIAETFSGAELVDVENDLCMLRARKTPGEIQVIRCAYKIAVEAFRGGLAAIAPGVTEREVAAEIEYQARRMGAEGMGIDTIVASGPNTVPVLSRTTQRRIAQDDLVILTVAPRYEGYHGAIARTVIVGQPERRAVEAVEAEARAQSECMEMMKAGVRGSQVEGRAREIMREAGFTKNFMYSGIHSVGVIEFEPPIFGPGTEGNIENGMVLSLDVPNFEAEVYGSRTENGYLIHGGEAELLTDVELVIHR